MGLYLPGTSCETGFESIALSGMLSLLKPLVVCGGSFTALAGLAHYQHINHSFCDSR